MKRIICLCMFVALALPTWCLAAVIGPARISYMDGDTLFRAPDGDEWLPATINTPLDEGDTVWCPDGSRVEIQLPDGTFVRLDGGSQLDLLANEDGFVHLHLASGHLYLRTYQNIKDNSLQIDADDTSVLPAARTRLRIDMLPNSLEDVAITKGSAYVEGNGDRTRVRAGEHIVLEEGHSEVLPLNPADEWETWNVDRDRQQSRSARSDSYLPDELRGYAAELETSGTWVAVPEYGRVWRPAVTVSAEWAPYRDGRWIWRGDDYVWLSFESWGWVPYHFGRWTVVSGFGWCWVPPSRGDVYWGPGYVGWYRTGSHVGWTPLAPGEVFYGHRNYGRHSVNITNININTTNVVYRNRANHGGLTLLPHNDFLRGRNVIRQPYRNPSVSVEVSVGSPRIKPLRETRMPVIKQVPPRATPPLMERHNRRELRERFPRVAPLPATERHRQQAAPTAATPAPVADRQPQTRDKRTTFPVVAPAQRTPSSDNHPTQAPTTRHDEGRQPARAPQPAARPTQPTQPTQPAAPVSQSQLPSRQQREERRQSPTPPQAVSQPAQPSVPITQSPSPVPINTPPRTDLPRRATQPADSPGRPEAAPTRGEVRSGTANAPDKTPPKVATPAQPEQPRREAAPRDARQKKVWKVTTPENGNERDSREKGSRGKERKEK